MMMGLSDTKIVLCQIIACLRSSTAQEVCEMCIITFFYAESTINVSTDDFLYIYIRMHS